MKTKFYFFTFLVALSITSCKKENTLTEYKYSDKPAVLNCENTNTKLYHEALYAFENDILVFYKKTRPTMSLVQAYSQFVRNANFGRLRYEDIVSPHTLKVFKALKSESDLWNTNNPKSNLNYNSTLVNCIANNVEDNDLKTTLNALLSTSSMSPKLFGTSITSHLRALLNDRYLATYVAFDLFYAKLFNIDFSKVNLEKPEQKVDFNKLPPKTNVDPHAGHNH